MYKMARTPLIALDYKDKHKAIEKELMIDYATGNIYVVSASDRSVIFDVTSKILEQLDNVQGDNVEVNIEGIGVVKLTEYLSKMQLELNKGIKAHYLTDEVSYFTKSNSMDNHSIDVINNDIQIKGFREAQYGSVPIKDQNGDIQWIHFDTNTNEGDTTVIIRPDGSESSSGDIIAPGNPDNGKISGVVDNAPYNGKIYLRASRRQITKEPYENLTVVLPNITLDQYSEIQWMLLTSDEFTPSLNFTGSIFWDNSMDNQPSINSHNLYTFKTWTGGQKWIATAESYNNASFTTISSEFLENNYYSKDEIDAGFFNKDFIDDNYYDKPETDEKIAEYERRDNNWEEYL